MLKYAWPFFLPPGIKGLKDRVDSTRNSALLKHVPLCRLERQELFFIHVWHHWDGFWTYPVQLSLVCSVIVTIAYLAYFTTQKTEFLVKAFSSKCDQIHSIWLHLLKKYVMQNFIFGGVLFCLWSIKFVNIFFVNSSVYFYYTNTLISTLQGDFWEAITLSLECMMLLSLYWKYLPVNKWLCTKSEEIRNGKFHSFCSDMCAMDVFLRNFHLRNCCVL